MSTLRINGDWNPSAVLKADGTTQHTDFLRTPLQRLNMQTGYVTRAFNTWYTPSTDVVVFHSQWGGATYCYIQWYLSPDGGTTNYSGLSYSYTPSGYVGTEHILVKQGWSYRFVQNNGTGGTLREFTLMG